ncbi:hypothetical protein JQX08_04710 [Pseudomonas sp. UL073]|uniref:Uncharacterized protein n=1 Tax=Zestomonas insulae TaxID=2809017 RepID=A0ABS2ICH2_9GAMM|nr:hypothetical protein [Pseudomonas insulae]
MAILNSGDAQNCTIYRPDENDPDAEETDMGDAVIVLTGPFEPPAEWDAAERDDFYADIDPALFHTGYIECEAEPGTAGFFSAEPGDYVAVMPGKGKVVMYYVYDFYEDDEGRDCVLIRDDEAE